ncbi:MAG: HypC/HybG/HupF family hydrogenase formation chaperone [Candidatus Diapherotrites archaeon]|uniref:HypC/HybG/HupF family hydrogenase formation chaperone n=1 Tax=Candidatus Iainarchaeum sp. TaxID=3101447 RepID=A0A7J4IZP6_9ARCH|nr:MAG: hypothetical protein QT03_C0001G0113 [archaeon GW2011_AR10]MBS3058821.1 HypC/HybG/HupF family hydrogenase formation chaperone [Candidatus Diapherotrites archaeon]HIH08446.1 HypC/HybG/HupF family hydrogenase formation chaperone [Candidatus Diapherotrites archaeon]
MCLAYPGKVVELKNKGAVALVDYGNQQREASNVLMHAKPGQWVLVQQKVIVQTLSKKEALESLDAWSEAAKEETKES